MEYLVGFLLSLATIVFAAVVGFDRERSFYSTVVSVIATYYVLFAVMGASRIPECRTGGRVSAWLSM
ncbi:MAG TPA: hypothetical protein VLA83_00245 [Candidatus Binatia bacterium]|nr:hypothetical protein [Candidatus Binatia bacterium]